MNKLISIFLILFFIFPVGILGIPLIVRTWLALLGFMLVLYNRYISIKDINVYLAIVPFFLFSLIPVFFNRHLDMNFISLNISYMLSFFAAYFIARYFKFIGKIDVDYVLKCVVFAIFIHSLLSLLMFISPTIENFRGFLISISQEELATIQRTTGTRLHGFCCSFFRAGVINGLGLIILMYLFLANKLNNLFYATTIYISILFVGVLLARTTLIGFILSLFFMLIWKWKNISMIKKKINLICYFIILVIIAVAIILLYLDERILYWAFEFFYNFIEYGEFSSESTDDLKTMYIFPQRISTWIYGDGLYEGPNGYYMSTDVGFLRLLFYGGIPIIMAFFGFHHYIIKKTLDIKQDVLFKRLLYMILLYVLILNLKGIQEMIPILALIYMSVSTAKKNINSSINPS